jgi:HK97 gp10 family phage protein
LTEGENKALTEIAKMLVPKMRKRAPRGATRKLRKYIRYQKRRKDKALKIGIYKQAFYGSFAELGTVKQMQEPFIMPVVEENSHEIQQIIRAYLKTLEK